MTAQHVHPESPDTCACDVIHLGGQAAVVVPMDDFLRLRALEQQASVQDLEDAEDLAALQRWREREAAGQTIYVSADVARARLDLTA